MSVSAFCHFDKILEKINLIKEKVTVDSSFQEAPAHGHLALLLWAWGCSAHHGGSVWPGRPLILQQWEMEDKGPGDSITPPRGTPPGTLLIPIRPCPRKGLPSLQHRGLWEHSRSKPQQFKTLSPSECAPWPLFILENLAQIRDNDLLSG